MTTSVEPPSEPPVTLADPAALLAGYLDFYRDAVLRKLDGLSEEELRTSRLPSGWTPLGLANHLAHVEMRWLRWGFLAENIEHPWGVGDEWQPQETSAEVIAFFHDQCAHSREIAANAKLTDLAKAGGRFDDNQPPTLAWILFHLLQEYARHVGHLDVARELADGIIGK